MYAAIFSSLSIASMAGDNVAITFAIVTVSDSCYEKKAEDESGKALEASINSIKNFNGKVVLRQLIPDDLDKIKNTLMNICDSTSPNVVLTTGGTGFSQRDNTPEATKAVIEKEAPGLSVAMLMESLKITPMAMLSRPVCGIRGRTVIVNLPGSKKGSTECLSFIIPAIPHAVHLLTNDVEQIIRTHHAVHQCHHSVEVEPGVHNLEQQPVARRLRKSPYPVVKIEDALKAVLENAHIIGIEQLPYLNCMGRVLAEDVYAKDPLPPFPASIKDGYAVLSEDGTGIRKVLGGSEAGSMLKETEVLSGQCVRINTGAPIPSGCDAVIQVEDTKLISETDSGEEELEIEILTKPKAGQDIRVVGSDIAKGQKVLSVGSVLGYAEMGILAAVGAVHVNVYKQPIIGVLSTGNELVDPNVQELAAGKIRDCNKSTLMTLLKQLNVPVVDLGIANDNKDSLVSIFERGIEKCDILISTGGVSMGDKDLLKPVLQSHLGAKLHFGRVFVKPGLPTTFMTIDSKKKLIFALPGNPVSAAVTCNLFAVPAIRKMCGYLQPRQTIMKVKLGHSVHLDPRPEYQRAVVEWQSNDVAPRVHITGNQISSRLLSMVSVQGLAILPPSSKEKPTLQEGEIVDFLLLGT